MARRGLTVGEFFERFPDDGACLDHLMRLRYGAFDGGADGDGAGIACSRCERRGRFSRLTGMPAYACAWCGHHIHPMQGTPFQGTHTPLRSWFYAMYLFTTTRHGVSAKELQRQLGVTYKTAWRMGHEIRKYMGDVNGDAPLGGPGRTVEADEAFIGGKDKRGHGDKTVVFGMVERGGEIMLKAVAGRKGHHLLPEILANVKRGTALATDKATAFNVLASEGYRHGTVHHAAGQYVSGPVHTNTIDGFWRHLKASIRGTHVFVSELWLPSYLGEFEFRFNCRKYPYLMFDILLMGFPRAEPRKA